MPQAAAAIGKIPTEPSQPGRGSRSHGKAARGTARHLKAVPTVRTGSSRVTGVETRSATRRDGNVIELDHGITVYPPRSSGGRWRAVWYEDGERNQCESVSEEKLTGKLDKVRQRIAMGGSNMTKLGADLVDWYLNPDRLPVTDWWSRKHADTQRRLC